MDEDIQSLAMLKMEKNFIAHNEKGYPRQPYNIFSLSDCLSFVEREMKELQEAVRNYYRHKDELPSTNSYRLMEIRHEIADVSNCLDYLYEKCMLIGLTRSLEEYNMTVDGER